MKLKSALRVLAAGLGLPLLAGCATYQVQVNGYTDPNQPAVITPGANFFVIESKDAKNPLLEKEIADKIGRLLTERGFRLVPFEQADYYLLFSYGFGPGGNASVTMPGFGMGVGVGYWRPSSYAMFWPGWWGPWPGTGYVEAVYDRWLLVNVIEGKPYRDKGQFKTVWVGESRSSGTSQDLREVINPLLWGCFKQFGTNTGKAVTLDVKKDDPGLMQLQRAR